MNEPTNTYNPRRVLDVLCDAFGFKDMDIYKIEVIADIRTGADVKVYHKGIRGGTDYSEVKEYVLTPTVTYKLPINID